MNDYFEQYRTDTPASMSDADIHKTIDRVRVHLGAIARLMPGGDDECHWGRAQQHAEEMKLLSATLDDSFKARCRVGLER